MLPPGSARDAPPPALPPVWSGERTVGFEGTDPYLGAVPGEPVRGMVDARPPPGELVPSLPEP
jgi:hypothetical protein